MTRVGAELLSAVAECNPAAAAHAVQRVFSSFAPDDAREAMKSGEALVEAMAKLCWWSEHFGQIASIYFVFAAAEGTSRRGGTVDQCLGLFQVAVPGTRTPLLQRVSVIDDVLVSPFEPCRILGVEALCTALTAGFCLRAGGVESQGERRPLPDYHAQ